MISSLTNDKIKYVEKLKKKASFRREESCFVVEGIRMIREVPEKLRRQLYVTEAAREQYPELDGWCEAVETVTEAVLRKLSDTETPQGMLAVVAMPGRQSGSAGRSTQEARYARDEGAISMPKEKTGDTLRETQVGGTPERAQADGTPLYLVLDGLQDPGNVGTLIRTAEAVGATAVLISRNSADPYSPKVVRSTMGTIFRVPVRICEDLPGAIRDLQKNGVVVYGTHLSGEEFYAADLTGPIAFLIGNEGNGLTEEVAATADRLLRIPMEGQVESLNAAVSGSVVAYEAYRQRHVQNSNI